MAIKRILASLLRLFWLNLCIITGEYLLLKTYDMQRPTEMTTLSQVLEKLRQKGIESEIKLNDGQQMVSEHLGKIYTPEDLLIFKTFRFEGDSDPADNSALYIVEDKEGAISYILDTYGAYSNYEGPEFDDFIKKIPAEDRETQELFE